MKIADFGIARAAEASRLTEPGAVLGTAAYLAPEQARGDDVTPATDVYALGAVLYECLTGRPPHTFDSLQELGRKQAEEAVVPVRDLAPDAPPELEAAIMRALARLPEYRPPSAAAFATALDAGPDESAATRVIAPDPTTRYATRRGRRLAVAAVAAVAVAVTAVALALDGDDPGSTEPPPATPARGGTPEKTARNLAAWLRANARED